MSTDHRSVLISELETMRKADVARKKTFQARAYAKVIEQLKALPGPVHSFDDVKDLEGAGAKIKDKMKEIIETGSLRAAVEAKKEVNLDAFEILQGIHGVGPVKAKDLIASGIRSIAELRAALEKDPKILNDVQKMGLKYFETSQERIPRAEMEMHEKRILADLDASFQAIVVGSYRRGLADSGDIDVLMTLPSTMKEADQKKLFIDTVEGLKQKGYIVDTLAQGPKKFLGYVKVNPTSKPRRLDLLMTPPDEFAYAILYFTGSQNFNVAFRRHAQDKGYTINEHEMKPTREGVPAVPPMKTEKDIFDFLGLEYVDPKDRRGVSDVKIAPERPRSRSRSRSRSKEDTKETSKEVPKKKRVFKIATAPTKPSA
jgi:DNA polymerase/3'-5' exonuclease PolX